MEFRGIRSRTDMSGTNERRRIVMRFVVLPGDGIGPEISATTLVKQSVDALLEFPEKHTADLGGPLGTKAFTAELCHAIYGRI